MIKRMIANFVSKLTLNDVYDFAKENGILLTESEATLIYSYIKKDWEELIFKDHTPILLKEKTNLSETTYKKLEELIVLYKTKYKNYL